jgi:hypothetical protein
VNAGVYITARAGAALGGEIGLRDRISSNPLRFAQAFSGPVS